MPTRPLSPIASSQSLRCRGSQLQVPSERNRAGPPIGQQIVWRFHGRVMDCVLFLSGYLRAWVFPDTVRNVSANNKTKASTIPAGIKIWSVSGVPFDLGNVKYVMAKPNSSTSSETTTPSPLVTPICCDVMWRAIIDSKTVFGYAHKLWGREVAVRARCYSIDQDTWISSSSGSRDTLPATTYAHSTVGDSLPGG